MMRLLPILLALLLTGCAAEPPPRPGTAGADAAGLQARTAAAGDLADQADRDAADAQAKAAAAEQAAKTQPTEERVKAAVAARLAAVEAQARAEALREAETRLRSAAITAQKAAAKERADELAAQDFRSWVRNCRIVGGAGIIGGILAGAAVAYFARNPRLGVGLGLLLTGTGSVVVALGPATAWMPWLVAAAAVVAVLWWALSHRTAEVTSAARKRLALAACRTIDAVERGTSGAKKLAKDGLHAAAKAARLHEEINAARGPDRSWKGTP